MNNEILKKYIMSHHNWEYINVDYFNIDGTNCEVKFYTDESHYYCETININIWDMVMFLNVL